MKKASTQKCLPMFPLFSWPLTVCTIYSFVLVAVDAFEKMHWDRLFFIFSKNETKVGLWASTPLAWHSLPARGPTTSTSTGWMTFSMKLRGIGNPTVVTNLMAERQNLFLTPPPLGHGAKPRKVCGLLGRNWDLGYRMVLEGTERASMKGRLTYSSLKTKFHPAHPYQLHSFFE